MYKEVQSPPARYAMNRPLGDHGGCSDRQSNSAPPVTERFDSASTHSIHDHTSVATDTSSGNPRLAAPLEGPASTRTTNAGSAAINSVFFISSPFHLASRTPA